MRAAQPIGAIYRDIATSANQPCGVADLCDLPRHRNMRKAALRRSPLCAIYHDIATSANQPCGAAALECRKLAFALPVILDGVFYLPAGKPEQHGG
jgi:hypothetical protein